MSPTPTDPSNAGGGTGGGGGGGGGGLTEAEVDARVVAGVQPFAVAGSTTDVPVAQIPDIPEANLPALRQRYAYYETTSTGSQGIRSTRSWRNADSLIASGDPDVRFSIANVSNNGASPNSITDQWGSAGQIWNGAGSYFDMSQTEVGEIIDVSSRILILGTQTDVVNEKVLHFRKRWETPAGVLIKIEYGITRFSEDQNNRGARENTYITVPFRMFKTSVAIEADARVFLEVSSTRPVTDPETSGQNNNLTSVRCTDILITGNPIYGI